MLSRKDSDTYTASKFDETGAEPVHNGSGECDNRPVPAAVAGVPAESPVMAQREDNTSSKSVMSETVCLFTIYP